MTIDERIEALTMNLEIATRDIEGLRAGHAQLTEHMGKLAAAMTTLAEVTTDPERRFQRLEERKQ